MDFLQLIEQIDSSHTILRKRALESIHQLMVMRNWLVGFHIVRFEQNGSDRASYGEKLIPKLSGALQGRKIKGMSETNLKLFRALYLNYPQIGQPVADLLDSFKGQTFPIRQPLADELGTGVELKSGIPVHEGKVLLRYFSFRHFTELIKIDDPVKRIFYEKEAISGNWSARELKRQVDSLLLERLGISRDKEALIRIIQNQAERNSLENAIKDPYIFEFTGFRELPTYSENDLESALLDKIQDFLLEMGNGFCFEARQKRISIGNEHDRIDLVFYHRILKCHILIDLKTRDFSHGDVGQMNFYLNYYKENIRQDGDNSPVGIILCTQKDTEKVRYATAGLDQKLFVSKYLIQLPSEEELLKLIKYKE
jgi:predicted nuclease of restriction endonuclease-like (RecB) superfamily